MTVSIKNLLSLNDVKFSVNFVIEIVNFYFDIPVKQSKFGLRSRKFFDRYTPQSRSSSSGQTPVRLATTTSGQLGLVALYNCTLVQTCTILNNRQRCHIVHFQQLIITNKFFFILSFIAKDVQMNILFKSFLNAKVIMLSS